MLKYVVKRILMIIPVVLAVSFIVFFIMDFVPSDPAVTVLGDGATEEQLDYYRETHGLNDPLIIRYVRYMEGIVQGDLGTSYAQNRPVWDIFFEKFPNTFKLAVASVVVTVLLSIPLGILAAVKNNTWVDTVCSTFSFVGLAMPNFWLGLLLIMLFSVNLHLLPSTGAVGVKSLILPAITCGTGNMAALTRITRSSMLDVLRQDYLRTARAKGQSEGKIITRHAFKNAQIPVVTQIGIQMSTLLGGAVLTERVFAWPGVGAFLVDSIQKSDFEVVTGFVIMLAIFVSIILLLVDVVYAFLDPRIKAQYSKG
ncbi:ABC transporter permease [Laedolimicola intestinihominis]|uniref:ABC transporter permease n=1 Tax=Laedolimicola intestinihominis TaxID=3133166 RepID=A0ABV1FIE3_9FIRM